MANGEDFLFRPILRGVLRIEQLTDCSVDLNDIADLNDALDVLDENEHRAYSRQ